MFYKSFQQLCRLDAFMCTLLVSPIEMLARKGAWEVGKGSKKHESTVFQGSLVATWKQMGFWAWKLVSVGRDGAQPGSLTIVADAFEYMWPLWKTWGPGVPSSMSVNQKDSEPLPLEKG